MEYRSNIHHEYEMNMIHPHNLDGLPTGTHPVLENSGLPPFYDRITCMAKVSNFSAAASLAMLLGKFRQAISRLDLGGSKSHLSPMGPQILDFFLVERCSMVQYSASTYWVLGYPILTYTHLGCWGLKMGKLTNQLHQHAFW
jgi:hypothetical protein